MHTIVIDELELHLSGRASASFYRHLDECADCKLEVSAISELSSTFEVLQADAESVPTPSPAFYSRVAERINAQNPVPFWGLLNFSEPFFRRLAFASLMVLAGLGSYLVTQESSYVETDAATIIAQHRDVSSPNASATSPTVVAQDASDPVTPVHDRNYMLVTLASYRQ